MGAAGRGRVGSGHPRRHGHTWRVGSDHLPDTAYQHPAQPGLPVLPRQRAGGAVNIPELTLDDLTWNDLVDVGRRAVPAASDGQWTLHAPVDPGITLMELFAAQLEQRLFTLDRVPDTLVRAVLRLLLGPGAGPLPATAATAVLRLASATSARLPGGSELSQLLDGRRVTLTTEHTAVAVPGAHLTGLMVAGDDRLAQLRNGGPVAILGVDGRSTAELTITGETGTAEHQLYIAAWEP